MSRPTTWHRGSSDAIVVNGKVAYWTIPSFMNEGETLVRLHWRYQVLASSPGGTTIAMFHPGAHGILVDDENFLQNFTEEDNPVLDGVHLPGSSLAWYWWESWSYRHWLPTAADDRWYGPADELERDSHGQRKLTGAPDPNNYTISFLWGVRPEIDWAINDAYVSWSALVMSA